MERHHEVIQPVREIKDIVVGWIANLIIPREALDGLAQESAKRTVEMFTQPRLPFDSEGNWHNPDGI